MQNQSNRWHGIAAAAIAVILGGLATGCADQSGKPTPAASKAPDSPVASGRTITPEAAALVSPPLSKARYVTVARGQSLNEIAHSQHMSPTALAAANHLKPPYKLKAGSRLRLPDASPPPIQQANMTSATPVPSRPPQPSQESQGTTAPAPPASVAGVVNGTALPCR